MPWKPEALEGQEWLALGTPVQQVLIDFNGMAGASDGTTSLLRLHKLWLSKRPKRIREGKAPKDAAQGKMLFKAIQEFMPHYAIDDEFVQLLLDALRYVFGRF